MSTIQHFVSNNNIPEFIKSDHEMFDLFLKAYYEWLEQSSDSESSNTSDVYKAVGNPGWINSNNEKVIDIDESVDEFIEYFAKEVCPIAIDNIQTNPRFFLKKIRDIYLAKGTPNSFKLFFKLYYNDDIDVFETRDTILRASDGKFFAFPTAHFYVSDYEDQVDKIDFTLAELLDDSEKFVITILNGDIVGKTKQKESIVKVRFADEVTLESGTYFIRSSDKLYQIQVNSMVSISELSLSKTAALYNDNDPLYIDSLELDRRFYGSITSVSNGTVEGIKVRDRGVYFTPNDYFRFRDGDTLDGKFTITETGKNGDVQKINNIPLKTGATNKGFLATNLEDVYIGITKGGKFDNLPNLVYNNVSNYTDSSSGNPYLKPSTSGVGLQITPVSTSIGTVKGITMNQETFFKDSDDVIINAPATVIVENNTLKKSDKVVFQKFGNLANYGPLDDDSEEIVLEYTIVHPYETGLPSGYTYLDSEKPIKDKITFVYGFDSETFEWKYKSVDINVKFDDFGTYVIKPLIDVLDSESNISYDYVETYGKAQIIDGGLFTNRFVYYFVHNYDNTGTEVDREQTETVYYSPTGNFNDLKYSAAAIKSSDDSDLFKPLKDIITNSHVGNVTINEILYGATIIDGGGTFSIVGDSEIDGGTSYNIVGDELIEGFDSFDLGSSSISALEIIYEDWSYDSEYDFGKDDSDWVNESLQGLDGGDDFSFAGAKVSKIAVRFKGKSIRQLEDYHFEDLDNLIGMDSDLFSFTWNVTKGEPRLPNNDSDAGVWIDLDYSGEVVSIDHNNKVAKVISYEGSKLPTQEELDEISRDKYTVIKLSPIRNGESVKDYSLPLTNIVHQVQRIDVDYKTSVVSSLFSKFYNQDGFISSDFGGTIQDNYYYSDYSYRIKSQLPMQDWKEKIKTMLHPAGFVMTSNYVQNLETQVTGGGVDIYNSDNFLTNLTFDMQQEYIDLTAASKGITTDGIHYKANAFEAINILTNTASSLMASNESAIRNLLYKQQSGNAWWDYEPIGLVRNHIDSDLTTYHKNIFDQYVNLDSEIFRNRYSTQDSDGKGVVKNTYSYFKFFDGSKQDFYKNQSRVAKQFNKDLMISKVQFEDAGLVNYQAYDSDLPDDFATNWADSENNFRSINYSRLLSDSDNRYFPAYLMPRTWDIAIMKEKDLQLAMREDGSLQFDDSDKIYYDIEAYERKWNQINNRRTRNNEGWSIKGYNQLVGYENIVQRNKKRNKDWQRESRAQYTLTNTPLNIDALEKDTLNWQRHYYPVGVINKTSIDYKYEKETYKDPAVSMRNRRRGR